MKRAFLVTGPESAGNRLLAAILIRAGCHGEAATFQPWDVALPLSETPAVVIRSVPHGDQVPDLAKDIETLKARGYGVTVLVTARDPWALAHSQGRRGNIDPFPEALDRIQDAYLWIFSRLADCPHARIVVVPMEALILHGDRAAERLLEIVGIPPVIEGPLVVEGVEWPGVYDADAKYYAC